MLYSVYDFNNSHNNSIICLANFRLSPKRITKGKNSSNNNNYIFEPIAVETLGVYNASARHLLADLGRRISINTGEARETSYLFQRISVLVQRFNAVLLHDSLPAADSTD